MNVHTPGRSDRRRGRPAGQPPPGQLETMVAGTYREMPGLSLNLAQAARLFGVSAQTCQIVLDGLVRLGHLQRVKDGQYRRP
jgi:hypothetical protein